MLVSFANFKSKRRFGVELEFNEKISSDKLVQCVRQADKTHTVNFSPVYTNDHNNFNNSNIKFDRSSSDVVGLGAWEFSSWISSGYKDIEKICVIADALKGIGVETNNNCSLHIHGEAKDFSTQMTAILVAWWIKIENVILQMVPNYRRDSVYCKPLTKKHKISLKKQYTEYSLWDIVRPKNSNNPSRRVSLNLCNYVHDLNRCTIEFRSPESCPNSKEIRNWLRFYLNFFDVVKKLKMPNNLSPIDSVDGMLEVMGLCKKSPFLILSKGLYDTKKWALNRIIRFANDVQYVSEAALILKSMEIPKKNLAPKIDLDTPVKEEKGELWKQVF